MCSGAPQFSPAFAVGAGKMPTPKSVGTTGAERIAPLHATPLRRGPHPYSMDPASATSMYAQCGRHWYGERDAVRGLRMWPRSANSVR